LCYYTIAFVAERQPSLSSHTSQETLEYEDAEGESWKVLHFIELLNILFIIINFSKVI